MSESPYRNYVESWKKKKLGKKTSQSTCGPNPGIGFPSESSAFIESSCFVSWLQVCNLWSPLTPYDVSSWKEFPVPPALLLFAAVFLSLFCSRPPVMCQSHSLFPRTRTPHFWPTATASVTKWKLFPNNHFAKNAQKRWKLKLSVWICSCLRFANIIHILITIISFTLFLPFHFTMRSDLFSFPFLLTTSQMVCTWGVSETGRK